MLSTTTAARTLAALVVASLAAIALTATASGADATTIRIWAEKERVPAVTKVANAWAASKGARIEVVQRDFGQIRDALKTVQAETAPDVIVGAHDWIGELSANGSIVPLFPSTATRRQFPAYALNAFSYGVAVKKLYGAPVSLENIALVTNTKLAKVPTTWAQLEAQALATKKKTKAAVGISVQQGSGGDAYHMYPLFAGLGAISRGSAAEMLGELGAFAGLMLAAWLLNEGLKAEEAYDARAVARPPAVPRKLFAAVLTGASVALAGVASLGQPLMGALAFGVVAGAAHLVAFGLDPFRKKGLEGVDEFATDRVARAIDQAEELVRQTADAAKRIGDRRLEGRLERLSEQAREVFRVVERDPRDLGRARTFLSVYLLGLRDATVKFADVWSRSRDGAARRDYEALLGDKLRALQAAGALGPVDPISGIMTATIAFFYLFNIERVFGVKRLYGTSDREAITTISRLLREGLLPR